MTKSDKKNKKNKGGKIFIVIFLICIAVAAYAGYRLISIGLEYKEAKDEYASLQMYAVPKSSQSVQNSNETKSDSASDTAHAEKKMVSAPLEVDFEALYAINPDIVGWLYIGAENISYPILHGESNDDYIYTTAEGTANSSGSIFMECQNSSDFSDPNTIIYGHNMKNQSMFGRLKLLYEYEDYLEDNTFWILTPEADYEYTIFSLAFTKAGGDVYKLFSGPSELVADYIAAMEAASLVAFSRLENVDYGENGKIVTLSTCSDATSDGRFVVQGLLLASAQRS